MNLKRNYQAAIFLSSILLIPIQSAFSQEIIKGQIISAPRIELMQDWCASMPFNDNKLSKIRDTIKLDNSEIIKRINFYKSTFSTDDSVITIPVVFHVVYNDSVQNIPDSMIYRELDKLNNDFRKLNADTINTDSIFMPLAADCEIEFCLAKTDYLGNSTSGITRTYTDSIWFSYYQDRTQIMYDSKGGKAPWPTNKYLNVWTCNLLDAGGYATYPGMDSLSDGVVINYYRIGLPADNLHGRTGTHEVGHWLNLIHLWGDSTNANCQSDDMVADTPKASTYNLNCNGFNTCDDTFGYWGNFDPPDMDDNFMSYGGYCKTMFTVLQKQRMRDAIYVYRPDLLTNTLACNYPTNLNHPTPLTQTKLEVFPNPSKGNFTIRFNSNFNKNVVCHVSNLLGDILYSNTFESGLAEYYLNLEHLKEGLYLMHIEDSQQNFTQRIVVH